MLNNSDGRFMTYVHTDFPQVSKSLVTQITNKSNILGLRIRLKNGGGGTHIPLGKQILRN